MQQTYTIPTYEIYKGLNRQSHEYSPSLPLSDLFWEDGIPIV